MIQETSEIRDRISFVEIDSFLRFAFPALEFCSNLGESTRVHKRQIFATCNNSANFHGNCTFKFQSFLCKN